MLGRAVDSYRAAFTGLPREVWLLAAATLVNRSGAMVLPFLGLYVTEGRGLPGSAAAWVFFAFGLGSIGGAWLGGRLCNRVGPLRVQQGSLLGAGVAYLLIPLAPGLVGLVAAVSAAGLLADAFRPAIMAAVADAAPDAVRTRALALVRLAANIGFAVGPSVGGLLASIDYVLIFIADALTCWLAALVLWRTLGTRRDHPEAGGAAPALHTADAHRDRWFLGLLGIVFVLTIALFQTFSTLPLYLHDAYGLPERTIGLLLGLNGLLIALFEMVIVRGIERRDQLPLVGSGALLLCAGLALLPLGRSVALAALAILVLTFGEMLSLPLTNALAASRGPQGARGDYMGLYMAAFALAFVVAPPLGIWVYQAYGGSALWFGTGALGPPLLVACVLLHRADRTRTASA